MTRSLPIASLPVQTPDGIFLAHYSDKGLMSLDFPSRKKAGPAWIEMAAELRAQISGWHKSTSRAVKEVLSAKPLTHVPPYDLSHATDFQRTVWHALEKIPIGETKTYGELAEEIGNSKAVRAVGRGCATNPIPLLIPCHRLVASRGKIGGFSGGLKWKEVLLRRAKMEGSFVAAGRCSLYLKSQQFAQLKITYLEMAFPKTFRSIFASLSIFTIWFLALCSHGAELNEQQRLNITFEALSRLQNVDLEKNPQLRNAVENLLKQKRGTAQFVQIVKQLGIKNQDEALLELAIQNPRSEHGVEAMRMILSNGNLSLVKKSLQSSMAPAAVEALGNSGRKESVPILMEIILDRNRELALRKQAVRSCAELQEVATQLLTLAQNGNLPPELKLVTSSELNAVRWSSIKAEAAKILALPPSQTSQPMPVLAELIKRKGNASRGEQVFFRSESACSSCHQIRGKGTDIGPALTEIGSKLGKDTLFEAILEPSAGISFGYEANQIELKSGDEAYGLIVSETEEEVALKDLRGIVTRYGKRDIAQRRQLRTSIMPTDLQKTLSTQELVDLVEFLASLRKGI